MANKHSILIVVNRELMNNLCSVVKKELGLLDCVYNGDISKALMKLKQITNAEMKLRYIKTGVKVLVDLKKLQTKHSLSPTVYLKIQRIPIQLSAPISGREIYCEIDGMQQ